MLEAGPEFADEDLSCKAGSSERNSEDCCERPRAIMVAAMIA